MNASDATAGWASNITFAEDFTFALPALSSGSVTLSSNSPKFGDTLTATATGFPDGAGTLTYKWYREGVAAPIKTGTDDASKTYTTVAADITKKITVKVSAANYSGEKTATTTNAVGKAVGPTAPTIAVVSKTHNSITVTANENWEYAKNGTTNWQTSNVFNDLSANTTYNIYARVASTNTHEASDASSALSVTTNMAPADTPTTPVIADGAVTDTTITVTAADGQKYMIKLASAEEPTAGDSGWQDATDGKVVFTGLTRNTAYKVYTFIPEGTNTEASAVDSTNVTTKKTTILESMFTVSDLTGKIYSAEAQEPTINSTTLTNTNYAVSYAVKTGEKGSLKDNKPCGAGTYVVTVAGTGDYQGSFTKDFTINKKTVTITPNSDQSKTYGASDPDLTYTTDLTGALATAFNTAKSGALSRVTGENANEYNITIGDLAAGDNFELQLSSSTVKFKINPKNVAATRDAVSQTVVKGVGDFTQPTFADEDGLALTGALTYSYGGKTAYADVKTALAALAAGATGTITYSFAADGNYTGTITGSISFTVVDIEFKVGDVAPTAENALTIKSSPVYGDNWSDIVKIQDGVTIKAAVGAHTDEEQSHFSLKQTGRPNAGNGQSYELVYNGTINGVTYSNVTVVSGTVDVAKKNVTITGITVPNKEYDGTTAATPDTTNAVIQGKLEDDDLGFVAGDSNFEIATPGLGMRVSFTGWTLTGDDADNYSLTQPAMIQARIYAKTLTNLNFSGVTVTKVFDGTVNPGTVSGTITFTGALDGETVSITATAGSYADMNVGDGKTVTLRLTPVGTDQGHYSLGDNYTKEITTASITKAGAQTLDDIPVNQKYSVTTEQTMSIGRGGMPENAGTLTYAKGSDSAIAGISSWSVNATTGAVSYTLASGGTVGNTITLPVKISSTNYEDSTVNVKITLTNKDVPTVSANDITVTYTGTALTDAAITGTATSNGNPVAGTWSFTDSGAEYKTVAQSATGVSVTFTPDDTANYSTATDTINVTINKATPSGTPTYTAITTSGKTLADAALGIGSITPTGSIKWVDSDGTTELPGTTAVAANTAYKWLFTPTDAANYNTLTGTLTLYHVSYGGGGGSASYAISVDKAQNGSITVSPKSASKGDTVTITVAPDKGYTLETLIVLDKNGKEITVTAKDGKYTFTMPASKVTVKGTFAEDNSMLNFFTDVPADAYYYDAVKWAVENGITNGINATEFGPDLSCTRGQIVTFLWRAAGCPEPKSMSSFSDVPADAFYAKAVAWAVENGITGGIGGNKFAPDETCTRAQSATFLYRAAGSPAVSGSAEFSDVGTDTFYANAVAWAAKEGITGGIGGGLFGSELDCTRSQIVTFLYRSIVK